MTGRKKVLAISGSTRQYSSNYYLIKAITELFADQVDIILFENIASLPHFNPDNNFENTPKEIADFRDLLKSVNGVIICTPEYAHGVPGTLKNAIDWTVSSGEFSNKPTVLITASTDGRFAHTALLEVLKTIEAGNVEQLQLLIPFIRTRFNADNKIKDETLVADITVLINRFIETMGISE